MAKLNNVDGSPLLLSDPNVVIGSWDTTRTPPLFTKRGILRILPLHFTVPFKSAPSVRFRSSLAQSGARNRNVTAISTAAFISIEKPVTKFVSAHGNPWLAVALPGTTASQPDHGYSDAAHPLGNMTSPETRALSAPTASPSSPIRQKSNRLTSPPASLMDRPANSSWMSSEVGYPNHRSARFEQHSGQFRLLQRGQQTILRS